MVGVLGEREQRGSGPGTWMAARERVGGHSRMFKQEVEDGQPAVSVSQHQNHRHTASAHPTATHLPTCSEPRLRNQSRRQCTTGHPWTKDRSVYKWSKRPAGGVAGFLRALLSRKSGHGPPGEPRQVRGEQRGTLLRVRHKLPGESALS